MAESIFKSLEGVPVEYLIASPLMASARANIALAEVMAEFINQIGFDEEGNPRLLTFNLERPYQDPDTREWKVQTIKVTAPLLGLIPVPALLVASASVKLTVKVSDSFSKTEGRETEGKINISGRYLFVSATATGSYKSTSTNTRETDYSAQYDVEVLATQQAATEGMNKLMDVMASVITPLPSTAS